MSTTAQYRKKLLSDGTASADPFTDAADDTISLPAIQIDAGAPLGLQSALAQAVAAPSFRVFYIDPTAGFGGDGSLAKPFNSIYAFNLQAGDIALLRGGTVSPGFTISASGTADQRITIASYGSGKPEIQGSVVLSGATNVTLTGLDITGGNGCGVMFTGDTASSVVQGCDIHGGATGVLISGGSSNSNAISGNHIYENDTVGVLFDGASASAGKETLVIGNAIYRNGEQGILLHTSHVVVDGNSVVNNGLSGLPGVSAIHVFGESANDPYGRENIISNNVVADQRDGSSFDGNGIQLDHWSIGNAVTSNLVFGNDGAGINVFSASNNLVMKNTLQGNVVDAGGTHVISKAELYVGEATFALGQTTGNVITDNKILASTPYAAAVQVGATVIPELSNVISGNGLGRIGDGPLWMWGTQSGTTVAGWNGLAIVDTDTISTAGPATLPSFDPLVMDRTFVLHSDIFRFVNPNGVSILVANGESKDVIGGPHGNWMAGDGRDNIFLATGGDSLVSAGSGNSILIGQTGNDLFFGGSGDNMMFAGTGNTMMVGGSGNSSMYGGSGDDLIIAGNRSGTDILDGGGGDNSLVGGAGADTFVLGSGVAFISQFTLGQDRLDVRDIAVSSFTDLLIYGDATGGLIADKNGVIHGVLRDADARLLSASDFIFPTIG